MGEYKINEIVNEYASKTVDPDDAAFMKQLLSDEIDNWIANYSNMGFYKEEAIHISDIMLFAESKDKALLLVHALLEDSNDAEAKLIAAHLGDDDKWTFRYSGMPTFYYEYSEELRKGQQFTDLEIIARTVDQLVEDGLVTSYGQISQAYLKGKWY